MGKYRKSLGDAIWLLLPFLPILAHRFAPVMDLFPDETGATNPWYLPVTTLVWWLSGLYLSPASAVWLALDSDAHFFSVGHYCIMVAYAAIIAYAINRVRQKQRRVNLKTD